MEQFTQIHVSLEKEYNTLLTTHADVNVNISSDTQIDWYDQEWKTAKIVVLSIFPVILVAGTIGNLLTFIVMQRGALKHSSTCFYMAMLAVADTCKYSIVEQRGTLKHSSTCFYMAMLAVADTCKYSIV